MEFFIISIITNSLFVSITAQPPLPPDIGGVCPSTHLCPDLCVLKDGTDEICVCRLFHKEDDGSAWKPGYGNCTDNYSPWALNPYEGGAVLPNPQHAVEIVPDEKITDEEGTDKAKYARLHSSFKGGKEWCASATNTYIQIDLGKKATVSMIATQGVGTFAKYTKTFQVYSSDDGSAWSAPIGPFTGNEDATNPVYNFFDPALEAKFLRFEPLTEKNGKCLRFEVYGERIMDECTEENGEWNNCAEDAVCTDTIGGHWCQCKPGYDDTERDGTIGIECGQVDECTEERHNCSQFATCTDLLGGFLCECFEGYIGDGYYCEDIDECENNEKQNILPPLCKKNTKCVNDAGAFHCECLPGYKGKDPQNEDCENINECVTGDSNCHSDAKCIDTPGSFMCECYTGYTGNGTFCKDDNECLGNPCHADARCANTKGSYKCLCDPGFVGNGLWCDDIDECISSPCLSDEFCHNVRGSYECMCPRVMPLQFSYKRLEETILDSVLQNFRDVTKEDWRYPVEHHAHVIRTIYQLVMRTYNYHYLEVRDPFYIMKVAGNSFAVELYDLRCKDAANVTFPNLCHQGYRRTEFDLFTDIVEMWLVKEPHTPFENWATTPRPTPPNPNDPKTTLPPLVTERVLTEMVVTDVNGTNITMTEAVPTTAPIFTNCGGRFNASILGYSTFTTPNYPDIYPARSYCVWELAAPERYNVFVEFLIGGSDDDVFELELDKKCSYDFVEIRDGAVDGDILASYCGNPANKFPKAIRSTREKLFVIFHSDIYYQYRGFKIRWGRLEPRVSIGCITYNQMSTMPRSFREQWEIEMEAQDSSQYVPVSRLMACRQYPQCNNSRPGPIMFTFEHFRVDRNDKYCIRWDLDAIGAQASTKGCKKVKTNKTHTICKCHTWGIVGVMGRFVTEKERFPVVKFELGSNSFFSVILVALMLLGTFLYVFLKDQWGAVIVEVFKRKEFDSGRILQMHIVSSTLIAEIFFFIISFEAKPSIGGCYFIAFLFYFALQTVFFWSFIYTLFLQSRVQEIFDSSKYNSYRIYLFVGYVVPFVVTLTIMGLGFDEHSGEKICWLAFTGTTVWGFSGVIVTLGVGTLILLVNIIYNAQVIDRGLILQEKCLKTMFTVFFVLLTSVFGAISIKSQTFGAQYMFSLCNLLQGASIAIMYCILRREDPVIKANQIGPLPDFETAEKFENEESSDDSSDEEKRKDMSEAPTTEEEDNLDETNEGSNTNTQRSSAILLHMHSPTIDESEDEDSELDFTVSESETDESDNDHEIMFRTDND